jgi:hypothetical protein
VECTHTWREKRLWGTMPEDTSAALPAPGLTLLLHINTAIHGTHILLYFPEATDHSFTSPPHRELAKTQTSTTQGFRLNEHTG